MMARTILHLDLDAFFCAVEELHDPTLTGKAFAVGGKPEVRGVVASCSYPARLCGVHSAMPMSRALRLCPELLVIPPRFREYSRLSRLVMDRLDQLSPLVEQVSIDEAFIDTSDLPISGFDLARALQSGINQELHLPCSIGVASNKLVAKIANDVGKSSAKGKLPPNAITVVPSGKEQEFLAPLPVERLWGVGPKTAQRLNSIGVETIADLTKIAEKELVRIFGKNGYYISMHARGIDDSPLITSHGMKSISQETTFSIDINDPEELHRTIRSQAETVGKRLREHQLVGSTVKIKLRWSNFTTITRQVTLTAPTDLDTEIILNSLNLFDKTWIRGKPVRLIGVGISGLSSSYRQLSLWDQTQSSKNNKERQLQTALDTLRDRYGDAAIQRASKLNPKHRH
jgi:DNA polymerase IV